MRRGTCFSNPTFPDWTEGSMHVLVLRQVVFVIEFKVGSRGSNAQDLDQVIDYALALKHFSLGE
ncbi:MAG: hypothetical protein OZ922_00080 [Myxococcales bacterium]|nr:hypothetical protein [Myxococcales bacterium]